MKLTVKHEQPRLQQHRGSPRRQQQQQQQPPYLVKGSVVEVSSDEEGLKGAWYQATILNNSISPSKKKSPHSGKVYVEYQNLVSDKDRSKPLREYVSPEFIRPLPPVESDPPGPFNKGDIVDAFYSDGWWTGVITNIVEGPKFNVTFQNPPDAGEFGPSELRVHREWVNNSWIPPADQEVSIPSDYKIYDGLVDKNGSSVEVTVPLSSSTPTKNTCDENTTFSSASRMNKIELVTHSNDEPQVINSSPREMTLDSSYSGKETLKGDAHAAAPSTETNASSYNASEILSNVASAEKDAQPLGADQLNESHSSQKNVKRKREKFAEKEETAAVHSRKTPEKKVKVKTIQNTTGGKEGNEVDGVIKDVPRDSPVIETKLPVILGLACVNSISSASKQSSRSKGEEAAKSIGDWSSFGETVLHSVKVTKQSQASNGSQKKGRGRPRKYVQPPLITPMLDIEGAASLETSPPSQVIATEGSSEMLVDDQSNQENQPDIKNVTSPLIRGGDGAVETLVKHKYVRQPAKRGKKRMINLNSISNVHDVASPTSVEGKTVEASCMTEESERVVVESPNNTLENQPLSKWFGDLNSPAEDSSRSDKTSEEDHREIIKEATAAAADDDDEIIPDVAVKEPEKLPFEKKSPIWSALESMQVLQNLPQKPHFQPLENFKENVREGLAIGLMVTFTGVVEKASNLKYDDDTKASIDDILETLMELETHGFNVGVVRERITGLERMKERREKLEEEARKLEKELEENKVEKSRMEEEMEEMKKKMEELKEKLSKATSMKEIKEGEIDSLHLKLMSVKEGMKNIRREFEGGNNNGSCSWLYGS